MEYCMLLWPHANARYRTETVRLAQAELRLMLDFLCPEAHVDVDEKAVLPTLRIINETALDVQTIEVIRNHSLIYAMFECVDGGLLRPVTERAADHIGADLPSILKYKGKTNELFLKMMLNIAVYSSDYAKQAGGKLSVLDPMCGRGTSLFVAANLGWDAAGSDIDRNDLAETEKFFKRYLEYHRMKYSLQKESRTMKTGKAVPVSNFSFAADIGAYKAKQTQMLRLAETDAGKVNDVFGKEKFEVIISDLPYGVQHAPGGSDIRTLLRRIMPQWKNVLKKGGTVAVSFNSNTLKLEDVRAIMEEAGLHVLNGSIYDGFSHWVEQAVTRDIAVARK